MLNLPVPDVRKAQVRLLDILPATVAPPVDRANA
jgi:hypothetical protein